MPFQFTPTKIKDVLIIEPTVYADDRGFFFESFNERDFHRITGASSLCFVQDNHSKSKKGVLRGLHYQTEQVQGKLVRVVFGAVFDVAVDLRVSSDTYGDWVGVELTAENKRQLWIPPGFAHGFLVISEEAEFLYKTTDFWHSPSEISLNWKDPALGIDWPVLNCEYLIHPKDQAGLSWQESPKFP